MPLRPKILIVEDEPTVANNLRDRVDHLGYDIAAIATTGRDAITGAGNHHPDIILMDIKLEGDMDGIEAAEEILSRFNIPIIYLTTYADDAILTRTRHTNPYGYLHKPIEDRELRATIEMALMKHAMEKQLRERERYLSFILRSVADAVIVVDLNEKITFVNPAAEELGSITSDQSLGKSLRDVYRLSWTHDSGRKKSGINDLVASEKPTVLFTDAQLADGEGGQIPVEGTVSLMTGADGQPTGAVFVLRDVSDKIRAEKRLRDNQERFRRLSEMAPEAVFETDENGYIIFINKKGFEYFGYAEEEFYTNFLIYNLASELDRERVRENTSEILNGAKSGTMEFWAVRKDGTTFPATYHMESIIGQGRIVGLSGIIVDSTEHKKQEQELLKNQKLDSLGILAGGIAHDFNNILTAILGNISLAAMEVDPNSEMFAILSDAERASVRARDLTHQLLTFSEGGSPVKQTSSIAHIIRDSAEFCLRGSNVKCDFALPNDLRRVRIDQNQMSQVINNIIINANQAMPTGGRIIVSADNISIKDPNALNLSPGDYIKIMIKDFGVGIPKADIHRIYDPFYSTKENSNGLGLAIAYSIIKKHGGAIDSESQPAVGTTFSIYLPASEETVSASNTPVVLQKTGTGRVLIMDDEAAVRKLAGRVLERLGYDVEYAVDGEEAVRLYREALKSDWRFDAVIMDLTIPGGMGGIDTLKAIKNIDPNARAVVSSGYSNDPVMSDFQSYGFSACVVKPYRPNQLASVINTIITRE